jgi:hypothetical protein
VKIPMPLETAVLNYIAEFTPEEFEKMSLGLKPEQMEDKWLIAMEGDTLAFYRSWTGHCIYRVRFEKTGENYSATNALVNRNSEQYNSPGDDYDIALLGFLIDGLLLGKAVDFPIPAGLPGDTPKGLYQHHVSGSAYPETPIKKKPWWKFWQKKSRS